MGQTGEPPLVLCLRISIDRTKYHSLDSTGEGQLPCHSHESSLPKAHARKGTYIFRPFFLEREILDISPADALELDIIRYLHIIEAVVFYVVLTSVRCHLKGALLRHAWPAQAELFTAVLFK